MTLEDSTVFSDALRESARLGRPWAALVEVTHRCHLRCPHCYLPERLRRGPATDEMSRDEFVRMLDQLADAGVFLVTFSGGEFFLSPDAFEYLEAATQRHFAIRIFSSLSAFPPSQLARLCQFNLVSVETSMYGADEATHDSFTRVPGSFARTTASIRQLVQQGIPVVVKTTWTSHNWRQYRDLLALVSSLGAGFRGTSLVTARNDGITDNLGCRLSDDDLFAFFTSAYETGPGAAPPLPDECGSPSEDAAPCGVGRTSVRIDPSGEVYPCVDLQLPAGSIRTQPFEEVWKSSPVFARLRRIRYRDLDFGPRESYDPTWGGCAVCLGANLKETGNLLRVTDEAKRLARVSHQARATAAREHAGRAR